MIAHPIDVNGSGRRSPDWFSPDDAEARAIAIRASHWEHEDVGADGRVLLLG